MPKVEVYGGQRVQEQSLQAPLQSITTDGSRAIAQGAQYLGASLMQQAERIQSEDDVAMVKERIASYRTKSLETLEQYRGVMGRDAYDSREKVAKSLEDYSKTLGDDLNERQKAMFTIAVQDYTLRDKATIGDHAFKERTTWLNGQDEAMVALAQEDYVANPNAQGADPVARHNKMIAADARFGELGENARPDGKTSTELSITVEDKELGGWVNIPLMVKGQVGVDALLNGEKMTPEQEKIAVLRARERVKSGASLPNFASVDEAVKAAESRTEEEKFAPYRKVNIYEQQIEAASANLAARNGWSPEKRELYETGKISEANVAIVNQYLQTSPGQAASFYQANKDKIMPSMRAPLEKQIVDEGRLVQQQGIVENLLVEYGSDKAAGAAQIRKQYSGKERDQVMSRWNARVSEITEYERISTNDLVRSATATVWEDGIASIDPEQVAQLKSLGKWEFIQNEHYAKASGNPQFNDEGWLASNYYNLPVAEQARVSDEELKQHTNYATFSTLNRARQDMKEPVVTQTNNAVIKRELAKFKIDVNNIKDDDERTRVNAFYDRYNTEISKFTDANNYAPTTLQQQEIIKRITAETDLYVDRGVLWNSLEDAPTFEVETAENIRALSDEMGIPATDIQAAMEYMNQKNIPLTQDNLRRVYEAGQ